MIDSNLKSQITKYFTKFSKSTQVSNLHRVDNYIYFDVRLI